MKIEIDCPVCCTHNEISIIDNFAVVKNGVTNFSCEDCGFDLLCDEILSNNDNNRCKVCGGDCFYIERDMSLFFLPKHTFCYVCGAKYTKKIFSSADTKYDHEKAEVLKSSRSFMAWQRRVDDGS